MDSNYELILVIVNEGFSGSVMDAAREKGATGGTVMKGRGTAKEETLAKFQIFITPEKEIVLILAKKDKADKILSNIYDKCGLTTDGHGIAFSLPVDDVVGIKKVLKIDEKVMENNGIDSTTIDKEKK